MKPVTLAFAALATAAVAAAHAGTPGSVSALPTEGYVVLAGTVEKVENDSLFILRDHSGTIDVEVEAATTLPLEEGSVVTVFGYMDSGLFSKDINATRVVIHEPV